MLKKIFGTILISSVFFISINGIVTNLTFNFSDVKAFERNFIVTYKLTSINDDNFAFPMDVYKNMIFQKCLSWEQDEIKYISSWYLVFVHDNKTLNTSFTKVPWHHYRLNSITSLEINMDRIFNRVFNCSPKVTGYIGRFYPIHFGERLEFIPKNNMTFSYVSNLSILWIAGQSKNILFDNQWNHQEFLKECFKPKDNSLYYVYALFGVFLGTTVVYETIFRVVASMRDDSVRPVPNIIYVRPANVQLP